MGDRLATIDIGQILGGCAPFHGAAGSPSDIMLPGPTPTSVPSGILIDPEIWPQQKWAKIGGCALFSGGGAGSQSDTMSPGPSPTSTPRGILINSTVWPQQCCDDFFEPHRNRDFGPKSKKIESSILPSQSYDFHESNNKASIR